MSTSTTVQPNRNATVTQGAVSGMIGAMFGIGFAFLARRLPRAALVPAGAGGDTIAEVGTRSAMLLR